MLLSARHRTTATITAGVLLATTIWALPQAATAAESTGSISGTVTGGYIEYNDGWATAYQVDARGTVLDEVGTPIYDDGSYEFTDLPVGTYKLAFTDLSSDLGSGLYYSQEWYNDTSQITSASAITVTAGSARTRVDANLNQLRGVYAWPEFVATPVIGKPVTVSTGTWPAGTDFYFVWYADGELVDEGTDATFTPTADLLGTTLWVEVYGDVDRFGQPSDGSEVQVKLSDDSEPVVRALTAGTPTVSGSAAPGAKLTAKPGTWTSGTTLSYQWYAGTKAISGAKSSTYTVSSSIAGSSVSVKVTGKRSGYETVTKTSASTLKVPRVATPTISGTSAVGGKLTAKPGSWSTGSTFTYQWYVNGTAIKGATRSTYSPSAGTAGKSLTVKVTGKRAGFTTVAKTSKATSKIQRIGTPTVSGSARVGAKVTAKPGSWVSGTSFSYQWLANGKAIKGATKSTYTISSTAKGKTISVKVTGRKPGYVTFAKTSKGTAKVVSR